MKIKSTLIFFILPIVLFLGIQSAHAKENPITICHVSQNEPAKFTTNQVNASRLLKHLDHGDQVGLCADHAATLCNDDNLCTTDVLSQDGTCDNQPVICDDGISCTTDTCEAVRGCVATVNCDDAIPVCNPTTDSCTGSAGDCPLNDFASYLDWGLRQVERNECTTVSDNDNGSTTQVTNTVQSRGSPTSAPNSGIVSLLWKFADEIADASFHQVPNGLNIRGGNLSPVEFTDCLNLHSSPSAAAMCLAGQCTDPQSVP